MQNTTCIMKLTINNVSFEAAATVISGAQKFVIPVPTVGAEALVNPASGEAIVDYKGRPIGDSGVVFFNGKDQSWQAAKTDGGVVIINEVTAEQAAVLIEKIGDIGALDVPKLKAVLEAARIELGLVDMYNSDTGFIASKMTPVGEVIAECFGLHKRDDRDLCAAVRVEGDGEFEGPAATPQKFENGAIIVKQGDSVRLVQTEVFLRTYTKPNGSALALDDIPVNSMVAA